MVKPLRRLDVHDHDRDAAGTKYVYAVLSRRAGGISVGVNLNPNNACNWQCIYCQVPDLVRGGPPPVDLGRLESELRLLLASAADGRLFAAQETGVAPRILDVALSGNGEPTSAREFPEAIDIVRRLLGEFGLVGQVVPRVITNGSLLGRAYVRLGLRRLGEAGGEAWFKIDAGTAAGFERVNQVHLDPAQVIRNLRRCAQCCPTWVQTCLFAIDGEAPDEGALEAYVALLREAGVERLKGVLLYTLARIPMQPGAERLSALPLPVLEGAAARIRSLGLTVRVSP